MIELLRTMIQASKAATLPLNMFFVYKNDCRCLCGDVASYENPNCKDVSSLRDLEYEFILRLQNMALKVFGGEFLATSIVGETPSVRYDYAECSGLFTEKELQHSHLTTDHSDRAIAIDYIEMVIRKCEERLGV